MANGRRRPFSAELRAQVVHVVLDEGATAGAVARVSGFPSSRQVKRRRTDRRGPRRKGQGQHHDRHGYWWNDHPAEGADWRADVPPRGDRGLDD